MSGRGKQEEDASTRNLISVKRLDLQPSLAPTRLVQTRSNNARTTENTLSYPHAFADSPSRRSSRILRLPLPIQPASRQEDATRASMRAPEYWRREWRHEEDRLVGSTFEANSCVTGLDDPAGPRPSDAPRPSPIFLFCLSRLSTTHLETSMHFDHP